MRRRRRKIKPRFIVFISVVVLVIVALVLPLFGRQRTAAVQWGTMEDGRAISCVILRDEKVVAAEATGKLEYMVPEGERVSTDTLIAQVYKSGYSEKTLAELARVQEEIVDYQRNNILKDIVDADLAALDASIKAKGDEIAAAVRGENDAQVLRLETELKPLLRDRQAYLTRVATADEHLQQLYDRQTSLTEQIAQWRVDVKAPFSGVVSFFTDGCEASLSMDALEGLTYSSVKNAVQASDVQQSEEAKLYTPMFRIVNNTHWYILVLSEGASRDLVLQKQYDIVFDDIPDTTFTGKLVGQRAEGKQLLEVLEVTQDIGPLLSVRQINGTVGKRFEGLKVPASALKTRDGQRGVYRVDGGESIFVPVDVLVEDKSAAIVQPKEEGALEVKQTVRT
nr:HlyD family efflux transporter periplasmic adaptor subunit [Maliibacterium massiliense]